MSRADREPPFVLNKGEKIIEQHFPATLRTSKQFRRSGGFFGGAGGRGLFGGAWYGESEQASKEVYWGPCRIYLTNKRLVFVKETPISGTGSWLGPPSDENRAVNEKLIATYSLGIIEMVRPSFHAEDGPFVEFTTGTRGKLEEEGVWLYNTKRDSDECLECMTFGLFNWLARNKAKKDSTLHERTKDWAKLIKEAIEERK